MSKREVLQWRRIALGMAAAADARTIYMVIAGAAWIIRARIVSRGALMHAYLRNNPSRS